MCGLGRLVRSIRSSSWISSVDLSQRLEDARLEIKEMTWWNFCCSGSINFQPRCRIVEICLEFDIACTLLFDMVCKTRKAIHIVELLNACHAKQFFLPPVVVLYISRIKRHNLLKGDEREDMFCLMKNLIISNLSNQRGGSPMQL